MMELITSLGLGAGAGWTAKKLFEPALEAMGEDIASAYKGFRFENLRSIFTKAEKKLEARQGENIDPLKPKLLAHLIEHASIEDDDSIQELWASIIATASSDNEADTLFLSNVLSRITVREVVLFSQFCEWSSFDFSRPLTADDFGDLQNTYGDLISMLPLPIDGSNLSWQPILTDILWHRNFWLPARIISATLPTQYDSIASPIYTARHFNIHRKAYDGLVALGLVRPVPTVGIVDTHVVTLNALEMTRIGIELGYRTRMKAT